MKTIFYFLTLPLIAVAAAPLTPPPDNHKIVFQNSIVAKVNDKTLSMMDVKKKLDLIFHKSYPHLIHSNTARYQFYQQSWKQVLMEMIDHELILADAADKEVKIADGELREEMERRFGPNTLMTLNQIGLNYDEAWKMLKDEMIVQRMSWWFIQARAMQKVTPEEIRQAYRFYLKNNPSYQEWKYRVVSIRGAEADKISEKIYEQLSQSDQTPDQLAKDFENLGSSLTSIQISNSIVAKDTDLSESYKKTLELLSPGKYSPPLMKLNKSDHEIVSKIFYCEDVSQHPAPSFEEMNGKLREQLTQEAVIKESTNYIEKLRKKYGYDQISMNVSLPTNFEPFAIE